MFSASIDTTRLADALRASKPRIHEATVRGTQLAGHELERAVKQTLTTSSHPAGTPTPSAPGTPPAIVTGTLRRSVQVADLEITPTGASVKVGPTTVYARIQELGGTITPRRAPRLAFQVSGHWVTTMSATLPPRPYLAPTTARKIADGSLRRVWSREWAKVWR